MWKKTGTLPEKKVHRAMFQRRYINAIEYIVTKAKVGRTWKKLDIRSPRKAVIKKDKPREPLNPNTTNTHEQRKCHKCSGNGQLSNNCLKQAKINQIVEKEGK
ncbi:hypothetical protein O181_083927 [Austropuccinia psidii MF-1]|uniref:Uncharacterized protein n=1 Tax=Austropuccinia psidii MF-1 TaxID=1389203 RepID=A0A9Q3IKI8_9BASI|nr:hypothetical protein [Austropuccinia psidii MF-1]